MAANKKGQTIIIKKVQGGHGGAHGGAWKVAYADFVTAMMAFFLVMWLLGADEETKAAIEQYFKSPGNDSPVTISMANPLGGERLRPLEENPRGGRESDMPAGKVNTATQAEDELVRLKDILEETLSFELGMTSLADQLKVVYDRKGVVLRIAVKDLFKDGGVDVQQDTLPILHRIGKVLANSKKEIRIEGHTDPSEHEPKGYASDWELSAARAAWVVRYWARSFPQMDPTKIQVTGVGHHRPIAKAGEREPASADPRSNRRVEIIVSQ